MTIIRRTLEIDAATDARRHEPAFPARPRASAGT